MYIYYKTKYYIKQLPLFILTLIDYWNNRIKTKYDLLNLPKMNSILCLTTTETSEPVANVRSTSRVEAALVWKHERAPADRVDLTSSKSAKHIFK